MVADFFRFDAAGSIESSEQSLVRSKFIPQMTLGAVAIAEIDFDVFSRHELVPILMALQHLYVNRPQVLEQICALTSCMAFKKMLLQTGAVFEKMPLHG